MTYIPRPNYPLIAALSLINRWFILRGYFRVQRIDLPVADLARLRAAVNRDTAAFIGPNHPEFGLDWMIDKELSSRLAPRMAFWASQGIVESAPWFWSRNNLVPHQGGVDSFEYSVKWALAGHGVLLHPEGMVRWDGDTVHPLYRGIAAMAIEAARRSSLERRRRRVYVVPLVWKLRYTHDVSRGIHADMNLIERECGLLRGGGLDLPDRLAALVAQLGDDGARERHTGETLTQEQVHEVLKRVRAARVTRRWTHVLHNVLPKPYGPRVAHVHAAEPILVTPDREVDELLGETRRVMQDALDHLTREIAPLVDRYRIRNPFAPTNRDDAASCAAASSAR